MVLTEQMYKNLYRPYFRGFQKGYDPDKKLFQNITFYSNNPLYSLFYAKKDGEVVEYRLKEGANIFNVRCKKDFDTLHRYIVQNHINISYDILDQLKYEDWSFLLGDEGRQVIIDAIFILGYDGFFNYEHAAMMKKYIHDNFLDIISPYSVNNTAVGVFDENIFKKVKTHYGIESLLTYEQIEDFKKIEKKNLINEYYKLNMYFGKEVTSTYIKKIINNLLVLSKKEAENEIEKINTTKTLEEKLEVLKKIQGIYIFSEAVKKYKKQLQKEFGLGSKQLSKLL